MDTGTVTLPDSDVREQTDDDEIAHIGWKDEVAESYVTGKPLVALCGKYWTPSRSPEGLPVCGKCKEVLARIRSGG